MSQDHFFGTYLQGSAMLAQRIDSMKTIEIYKKSKSKNCNPALFLSDIVARIISLIIDNHAALKL